MHRGKDMERLEGHSEQWDLEQNGDSDGQLCMGLCITVLAQTF